MPSLLEDFGFPAAESAQNEAPAPEQQPQQASLTSSFFGPNAGRDAQQHLGMTIARLGQEQEPETVTHAVIQRLPFIRSAFNWGNALLADQSQARISQSQGTQNDFERVAAMERIREIEQQRTPGENLGETLLNTPAMAAEALMGGRAVTAAGGVLGSAVQAAPGASAMAQAGAFTGRSAATAAVMGNWLPSWAENNRQNGRRALDVRGLPPAFGHEVATMAVLGSLGHFGDSVGANTVGGFLQRGLARVGLGMAEQQALDVATSAVQNSVQHVFDYNLGLDAGYGLVGQVARGEGGAALANATQQALTFAVFAGMHEAQRTPIMREFSSSMRDMRRAGVPAEEAGQRMSEASTLMQAASERDLTRSETRTLLDASPIEGPARRYADVLLSTIPVEGRGSRALLNQPKRTESLSDLTGPTEERLGPPRPPAEQPSAPTTSPAPVEPTANRPSEPLHPIQEASNRLSASESALQSVNEQIKKLPKKGGAEFDRLTSESKRLFAESQVNRKALADASRASRGPQGPRQGAPEPKVAPEPLKAPEKLPDFAPSERYPAGFDSKIGTHFAEAFPGSRVTERDAGHPAMTATVGKGEHQRTIEIVHYPERNSVRLDFIGEKSGVPGGLQAGTRDLIRGLNRTVAGMRERGLNIEYIAKPYDRVTTGKMIEGKGDRAGFYAKLLEKGGYEPVSKSGDEYVWKPKAAEPPAAPKPEAAIPTAPEASRRPTLQETMTKARLTPIERHVIEQLHGPYRDVAPTHEEIGQHPETARIAEADTGHKGAYTRAGIQAIEARAILKMSPDAEGLSAVSLRSRDAAAHSVEAVDAVIHGTMSLEKVEKKLQNIRDFLTKKETDLHMEVAADSQAALEAGISLAEINKIIQQSITKGKNVTASSIAKARGKLAEARRNKSGVSAPEPATPVSPRSGENPVETQPQPAPAGPAEAANPVSPVQSAAVPGSAQASAGAFGAPVTPAERAVLPGGGQENAGAAPEPPKKTANIANASIDAWREKEGLPAILSDARRADPVVWDKAMAMLTENPRAGSQLVDEILAKPRATTAEENALLLQRTVAVRNERTRNMLELIDTYNQRVREGGRDKATPETAARLAQLETAERDLGKMVDDTDKASHRSGSEWGRAGRWRQMLVAEDFSLAGILQRAQAAKGDVLSEAERTQIADLHTKLAEAQKKLEEAEKNGQAKPGEGSTEGFNVEEARKPITRIITKLKEQNQPWTVKAIRYTQEAFSLPKSVMASIDFPWFRQGALAITHPAEFGRAAWQSLQAFRSEKAASRFDYDIHNRPGAAFGEASGLDVSSREGPLKGREEGFLSNLINQANIDAISKRVPVLGAFLKILPASERGFTTFSNSIRSQRFDALAANLATKGKLTDSAGKVIANFVNVMTGRGALTQTPEKALELLNATFFAPRWVISRFQYVLGQPIWGAIGHSSPAARSLVAKEFAGQLAALGGVLGLAAAAGFKVVMDPKSSEFGQVQVGNTFLDVTGGLRRPVVLLSQLWSGKRVDRFGVPHPIRGNVPVGQPTAADTIMNYGRRSLSPAFSAGMNLVTGEDPMHQPTSLGREAGNLVSPLFIRDVAESMKDLGVPKGTAVSLLTLMGMGTVTHTDDPRAARPVTPDTRRDSMIRGRLQILTDAMRGQRREGGRVIHGPAPSDAQKARIQQTIDSLVRQLP